MATTPAGFVIYQVTEIQPPQTPTFEQIKDKVEDQFGNQRAQAVAGAEDAGACGPRPRRPRSGQRRRRKLGATLKTSELVDRNSQVPDIGAMSGAASVAFTMKPGAISAPIQSGHNGVVLKILEVQEPTPEQIKQGWEKAKETLLEQKREEYENLYVENLRTRLEKEGKIKINKKEMERLSRTAEGS